MTLALAFPHWEEKPVHPANNAPPMRAAELKALAADIKKYGLQEPIVFWRDNREEMNGASGPFPVYLLDGRNRLAALKLLGIKDPTKAPCGKLVVSTTRTLDAIKRVAYLTGGKTIASWETDVDPAAFHLSMNVHRRHLTTAQKRWQIKHAIIVDPQASNRKIAQKVGTAHNVVAEVRTEIDVPFGTKCQKEHIPIERAKAALETNPDLTTRELQKAANVAASTADKARKQQKTKDRGGVPSKRKTNASVRESEQAAEEFVEWLVKFAERSETPIASVVTWLKTMKVKLAKKLLSQRLKQEGE